MGSSRHELDELACPGSIAITIFFARSWTAFDCHSRAEVKRTFDLNITRAFTCKSIIVGGRHGCAPSKISASRPFGSNRNSVSLAGIVRAAGIPTGFRPKAQGCEGRATLGVRRRNCPNPNGVAAHSLNLNATPLGEWPLVKA